MSEIIQLYMDWANNGGGEKIDMVKGLELLLDYYSSRKFLKPKESLTDFHSRYRLCYDAEIFDRFKGYIELN